MKSLGNNKENDYNVAQDEKGFYEVYVRDFKNNIQIVFQFSSNPAHLAQSVCAVLLYDITRSQTLASVRKKHLEVAQANMNKDHSFIYLIGNKLDLEGGADGMAAGEGRRQV